MKSWGRLFWEMHCKSQEPSQGSNNCSGPFPNHSFGEMKWRRGGAWPWQASSSGLCSVRRPALAFPLGWDSWPHLRFYPFSFHFLAFTPTAPSFSLPEACLPGSQSHLSALATSPAGLEGAAKGGPFLPDSHSLCLAWPGSSPSPVLARGTASWLALGRATHSPRIVRVEVPFTKLAVHPYP